jgi:heptosyltransferase-2
MTRPDRILLAQTSFLGDVVLTTALAQAVRAARPEADLYWLVRPEAAPLLAPIAGAERVLVFDKRGSDAGWSGLLATAKRLRALRFDVAMGVQRSLRTAALLALAGIPLRIGFAGSPGSLLYHQRVPRRGAHARDRLLSLAAPLGGASGAPRTPALTVDEGAAQALEAELRAAGVAPGERLLVLAPGSAWATKRWPAVRFAEAAENLLRAEVDRVAVIGSGADRGLAAEIAARLPASRVVDLTGRTDTAGMVAALARATLVLANDSAPAHVAAALGVPVVAVFGPTVPEQGFAPLGPSVRVVGRVLGCRPCSRHGGERCPIGTHECMRDLGAAEVVDAGRDLIPSAPIAATRARGEPR